MTPPRTLVETSHHRGYAARGALIAWQLSAVLLLVWSFEIETRSFFYILLLTCIGFLASVASPPTRRLPLFGVLSVVSVIVAIGVEAGVGVLAVGSLLIAICHLPIALSWRKGLLLLVVAALAMLRAGVGSVTILPSAAVVVLASIFMFRLGLYLHAIRRGEVAFSAPLAMSYFFMLPNACFPLFPVVDYETFVRSRFDAEEFAIYEQGVRWMFRGLAQLLVYRFVVSELAIGETGANDVGDVAQHVLTTFLLYIQVSGRFHLIVGILHLYGFRLPPTHHLYFLASSFADFWRRINIYWKDFMLKLVFYPSYFRLRRHGTTTALVASTIAVFGATWALHSYQHFWIEGSPLLSWRDASFWALLAVLVVAVTLRESRARTRPPRPKGSWMLRRALSTLGTFLVIAVLWSLWDAESFATWLYMWTQVRYGSALDLLLLATLLVGGFVIAGFGWGLPQLGVRLPLPEPLHRLGRRAGLRFGSTVAFCLLTLPAVRPALPPQVAQITRHLQGRVMPFQEQSHRFAAYYEKLNQAQAELPYRPWRMQDSAGAFPVEMFGYELRNDFLLHGLRPGFQNIIGGKAFTVNRWGMRDRDYDTTKPEGTMRIAVIGPSDVMGWGVADDETFEALVESSLDSLAQQSGRRVEILNFSVPAVSLTQEVHAMASVTARFSPDLVLLAVHTFETPSLAWKLREVMERGIPVPDSVLAGLMRRTGIIASMSDHEIALHLRLVEEEWYHRLAAIAAETARRMNARVAGLVLRDMDQIGGTTITPIRRAMRNVGVPMLECGDAFSAHDAAELWVSPEDLHPNAAGHRLIAACVRTTLLEQRALLSPWTEAPLIPR